MSDKFCAWCQLLDQLTISNLLFSNISLSIFHWQYNYLLLGFRILVGHISYQNLRKFVLITRIILQKQKYDIQIFPKYSWMTVLFEKILIVKDIMKYFLSKWFSLKRSFERYFYLLRILTFMIPYWTYWSLVILLTGHMRTRSYENTPVIESGNVGFGHGSYFLDIFRQFSYLSQFLHRPCPWSSHNLTTTNFNVCINKGR